jgi:hypothetical protein
MNSSNNHQNYVKKNLSMEATFRSNENEDIYIYGYVTYDRAKLKGPEINKVKNYIINARGRIPISENEFLDMSLNTGIDNQIIEFHMTYVRNFNDTDDTILTRKFGRIRTLNIRTDIGPHRGMPHIDVEIFDLNKNKVFDEVVKQDEEFPNYESAISAVFRQVEKLSNPLVGAQYWLSPTQIFPERVERLAKLREQNSLSTSLSTLSRVISVRTYEETRNGIIIDEKHFWKVAEFCIQLIKEKESELGGDLDVEIPHPRVISSLPFLFFFSENAEYSFKAYHSDGSEVPLQGELSGVVWHRRDGINLIRDPDSIESKLTSQ